MQRYYAKYLNAKNVGLFGGEDIQHDVFSIECKERNQALSVEKFVKQAETNTPDGKIPLVIFHKLNDKHENDLFIMRRKDIEKIMDIKSTEGK